MTQKCLDYPWRFISLELPKVWDRLIEQNSSKANVLTKEGFLNEFNK